MQGRRAANKITRLDVSDSTLVRLLVKNTNKGDVLSLSYDSSFAVHQLVYLSVNANHTVKVDI